eukprot:3934722-Rhodomonas_salina.3
MVGLKGRYGPAREQDPAAMLVGARAELHHAPAHLILARTRRQIPGASGRNAFHPTGVWVERAGAVAGLNHTRRPPRCTYNSG